jgi:hypothetical protein
MTKQEARELIEEYAKLVSYVFFWCCIAFAGLAFGLPYLEAHNAHGRPVYAAAAKGDQDAIAIIESAAHGDRLSLWILGEVGR